MDIFSYLLGRKSGGGGGSPGGGGGGGGFTEDFPVGDGKTRLYMSIANEIGLNVPLYIYQTKSNGVSIDWGDGSAVETIDKVNYVSTSHAYTKLGNYIITLDADDGCVLAFGSSSSFENVVGPNEGTGRVRCSMLRKLELGEGIGGIGAYAFRYCYLLSQVKFQEGVARINSCAFQTCNSLTRVEFPASVVTIQDSAFDDCRNIKTYDFTHHTVVPSLGYYAFNYIPADCEIRVPAALVDEWKAATNWSSYASYIVGV